MVLGLRGGAEAISFGQQMRLIQFGRATRLPEHPHQNLRVKISIMKTFNVFRLYRTLLFQGVGMVKNWNFFNSTI